MQTRLGRGRGVASPPTPRSSPTAEGLHAHAAAARAWRTAVSPARPRPALRHGAAVRAGPDARRTLDLSDNVNLWGVPPAAARALREPRGRPSDVYPRSDTARAACRARRYAGVSAAQVVTGCGSDDVIDGALRAFAAPGEKVAYSAPSFSMLVIFARMNGLEPAPVAVPEGRRTSTPRRCSPSAPPSPTSAPPTTPPGRGVSPAAIERVVAKAEGLVLVDEAYGEFSGRTAVPLLARAPQLLVTADPLQGLRARRAAGRLRGWPRPRWCRRWRRSGAPTR